MDPGHATTEQRVTTVRSTEFAARREDVPDASLGRRLISDAGRPSSRWPVGGSQPVFQTEPPATVRPSGSGLSDAMVDYAGVSGHEAQALGDEAAGDIAGETLRTGPLPGPGLSAPGQSETSQFASTPVGNAVPLSQETSSAESDVVVPPAEGPTEARRLPIFEAVESNWFRGGRTVPGSSGVTAAAGSRWASPADEGWHAASNRFAVLGRPDDSGAPQAAAERESGPGAIPSVQPVAPKRSAAATRDRLARLQRGVSQGRAAAGEAAGLAEKTSPNADFQCVGQDGTCPTRWPGHAGHLAARPPPRYSARKVKCATSRYLNRDGAARPIPPPSPRLTSPSAPRPSTSSPAGPTALRTTPRPPPRPGQPPTGSGSPPSSPASPRATGAATNSPFSCTSSPGTCSPSPANGHVWASSPAPASAPTNSTRLQPIHPRREQACCLTFELLGCLQG